MTRHAGDIPREWTRRRFLTEAATVTGVALAGSAFAGSAFPGSALASSARGHILVPRAGRWNDPDLPTLARHAVEVAMHAGATYADTRLTLWEQCNLQRIFDTFTRQRMQGVGVRVLAQGQWGFMSSALWTTDEMERLARGAVAMARTNAAIARTPRTVDLGTIPVVTGEWTTPVKYDPFLVPPGEIRDVLREPFELAASYADFENGGLNIEFSRLRKVFASSEGSAWTQTTYRTGGGFSVQLRPKPSEHLDNHGGAEADGLGFAGRGWEHLLEANLTNRVPQLVEEARASRHKEPLDVGRYDLVVCATAMGQLAAASIGMATELDRALGYEANATGTSYLNDPLTMLGSYQVGAPLLNVTANRSTPGCLGTVQWDDEAVVPDTFALVTNGILTDFQTTREQAAWLAPYYTKANRPVTSHGCASSESALFETMQTLPNVQVMPGAKEHSLEDLIAGVDHGIVMTSMNARFGIAMDQQQSSGVLHGTMRKIVKGKLGPYTYPNCVPMFHAPQFWKGLTAIGGPSSTEWSPVTYRKGQPEQMCYASAGGVPGRFNQVPFIDFFRGVR
jgi:TldD protein